MIGLKKGTVQLVPHNPQWYSLYEQEKALLTKTLANHVLGIEHIGSTAIPDISAKPILDISVGIKDIDNFLIIQKSAKKLEVIGYEWRKQNSEPDHHIFAKGPEEKRIVYLHLIAYDGEIWTNDLLFRNYLQQNLQVRLQYERLKKKLAEQYPNERDKYTKGKRKFITSILEEAKIVGTK